MFRKIFLIAIVSFLSMSHGVLFAGEVLKLATTTSTYETGILDEIIPIFEKANDCRVHIISVGTGRAIKLGMNGDVDVILVHARSAEDEFVNNGYGIERKDVMYNDFIIIGPASDPSGVSGLVKVETALRRIREDGHVFVSRGDDSGTDKKEKSLWRRAGVVPEPEWYLETGQGMAATLRIADEKDAYLLIDRATYLFNMETVRLIKHVEGGDGLFNPYGVIAINPKLHSHVNYKMAMLLIEWLVSPDCQAMINGYEINKKRLFYGNAGG